MGTLMDSRQRNHPKYILDNFTSLDQVTSALRESGLESSNLILGIDFTKSNECTGKYSFQRRNLHAVGNIPNPYEQAISIISRTLSPFDDDNMIPCFGFGDASTHDQHVFRFFADQQSCRRFEEVLSRYREIVPYLKLLGPTSFGPIIDAAIDIVAASNGQFHVLVIIADGQVTRIPDLPPRRLSPQEQATINSIVSASQYPLSIILVGVGDGPWDAMKQLDNNIPHREFDNFQVVRKPSKKEAAFAPAALMEIPFQYRAAQGIGHLRDPKALPRMKPLPPPLTDNDIRADSLTPLTGGGSLPNMPDKSQRHGLRMRPHENAAPHCPAVLCAGCLS
ncbi:hypothetical protein MLD38_016251 [Melastoma candidum]|uniref:Uncharacterized protein n=1 Tax=Melastoma candidum TaxID=119954 RepID=A0ACB9RIE6_9MYRT|nr:hypothetical protein MLD38_016251 [Melastoma candidum]